jgi:hypothetical protein
MIFKFNFKFREETLVSDPLADRQFPSSAFRHAPPQVVSLRPFEQTDNYQRSSRHYIGSAKNYRLKHTKNWQ